VAFVNNPEVGMTVSLAPVLFGRLTFRGIPAELTLGMIPRHPGR
jgi:hypothetical protein